MLSANKVDSVQKRCGTLQLEVRLAAQTIKEVIGAVSFARQWSQQGRTAEDAHPCSAWSLPGRLLLPGHLWCFQTCQRP